jgi:hypothetical protein
MPSMAETSRKDMRTAYRVEIVEVLVGAPVVYGCFRTNLLPNGSFRYIKCRI